MRLPALRRDELSTARELGRWRTTSVMTPPYRRRIVSSSFLQLSKENGRS